VAREHETPELAYNREMDQLVLVKSTITSKVERRIELPTMAERHNDEFGRK
jgi:hypothetical protein